MNKQKLASMIDHTILKPEATADQVIKICQEAKTYKFASVCVNPCFVSLVKSQLQGSGVLVCTVIGFPLGANTPSIKAAEASQAVEEGAQDVDMVINIGALKSGDYGLVKSDIIGVVNAVKGKAIVKVIIETCLLNEEEKIKACQLAKEAGADFVKTSTGFSTGGAKVEDISLMRKTVGENMGVKASGGIRDYLAAKAMIEAGASRVGASASIAIVEAANESKA